MATPPIAAMMINGIRLLTIVTPVQASVRESVVASRFAIPTKIYSPNPLELSGADSVSSLRQSQCLIPICHDFAHVMDSIANVWTSYQTCGANSTVL